MDAESELKIKPESPEPLAEVMFTTHAHISPQARSILDSLPTASSAALPRKNRERHRENAHLKTVLSSVSALRITRTHHLFQPELWQIHFPWFEAESEGLI